MQNTNLKMFDIVCDVAKDRNAEH